MKLKKYKKKTIGTYISREIVILITGLIISVILINNWYHKFSNVIMPLADAKARQYLTEIIKKTNISEHTGVSFDDNYGYYILSTN